MNLAPIALFVYNRPTHLQRTIASLAANPLAAQSDLWIFSDAPKVEAHAAGVQAVRACVRTVSGFRSVNIVEQLENQGLATSIISGVTQLCEQAGRVIVLEDDLLLAPRFLDFVNQALERYAQEPRVMQVSGYMFPVDGTNELPQAFFCRLAPSWGWATWGDAWAQFRIDGKALSREISDRADCLQFDMDGAYPYRAMLAAQARGELDVWGVRWYASMFLRDGLCLYPRQSLVRNIGMDGSGMHCGPSTAYDVDLGQGSDICAFPGSIVESPQAREKIVSFFRSLQEPWYRRRLVRMKSWARSRMRRAVGASVDRSR
jgi:hypothetical protein